MSEVSSKISKKTKRGFQTQKIYIQKFGKSTNNNINSLEEKMVEYFSMFGDVIDKKILETGRFIRI